MSFKRFSSAALVPYIDSMFNGNILGLVAIGATGTYALFNTFSTRESLQKLHEDLKEFRSDFRSLRGDMLAEFRDLRADLREKK